MAMQIKFTTFCKEIYTLTWNHLDAILKSLLHALNTVFTLQNEVTNVTLHYVGKYKLVPVSKNAEKWFMDKWCQLKIRICIDNISVYSNRVAIENSEKKEYFLSVSVEYFILSGCLAVFASVISVKNSSLLRSF